jgi:hypothetical protein
VVPLHVKIALQPSAALFAPLSDPPPLPLSHFGTPALNSKFRPLPFLSANLCALGVSALAFLFPRSSLPAKGYRLMADSFDLNPFLSHNSQTRARNSFRLISLHKTRGFTLSWSYHAYPLSAKGCRLTGDGSPLSPFSTSLTQKQGGIGYWYDQSQTEEADLKDQRYMGEGRKKNGRKKEEPAP